MILQFLIGASVSLSWDASPSPEVVKYYIYEKSELQSQFVKVANTAALTITIPVKPMLSMQYAATAADASDTESDFSNIVSFIRLPALVIRTFTDGPIKNYEIKTDVYAGLNWILQATRNFTSWTDVSSGTATTDALTILFNAPVNEPKMFYRLKKNVQQQMTLMRSIELSEDDKIAPLTFRAATRWEKFKYAFRYRGYHKIDERKGAERLISKPELKKEIPMPPLPFRVEVKE